MDVVALFDIPGIRHSDSLHLFRVWEIVVHWMVGGIGLITFQLMLVNSKSYQSHPASSKGVRTSVAGERVEHSLAETDQPEKRQA